MHKIWFRKWKKKKGGREGGERKEPLETQRKGKELKALGRDFTIFFPKASLCHIGFSFVFASPSVLVNLFRNRRVFFQKRRRSRRRKCRRKRSGEGEQGRRGEGEEEEEGRRMKMTFFSPQLLPFFFPHPPSSIQTLGPFFFGTWRRGGGGGGGPTGAVSLTRSLFPLDSLLLSFHSLFFRRTEFPRTHLDFPTYSSGLASFLPGFLCVRTLALIVKCAAENSHGFVKYSALCVFCSSVET